MGLQVPLREVGALAALDNAAHEEGAALALFDALDRVCAAVHGQTWTHLIIFLLVEHCTVIAEHMLTGNHSAI